MLIVKQILDGKRTKIKKILNRINFFRLEPLLLRIKEKRSAVLCPSIDMISDSNMAYGVNNTFFEMGFMDLNLNFYRAQVLEVSVDFGGHYILIGYQYHNEYVMPKSQELIPMRACLK
jgi:hypothetical protein